MPGPYSLYPRWMPLWFIRPGEYTVEVRGPTDPHYAEAHLFGSARVHVTGQDIDNGLIDVRLKPPADGGNDQGAAVDLTRVDAHNPDSQPSSVTSMVESEDIERFYRRLALLAECEACGGRCTYRYPISQQDLTEALEHVRFDDIDSCGRAILQTWLAGEMGLLALGWWKADEDTERMLIAALLYCEDRNTWKRRLELACTKFEGRDREARERELRTIDALLPIIGKRVAQVLDECVVDKQGLKSVDGRRLIGRLLDAKENPPGGKGISTEK